VSASFYTASVPRCRQDDEVDHTAYHQHTIQYSMKHREPAFQYERQNEANPTYNVNTEIL